MKFILRASALAVTAGLIVGIAQPAHAGERVTAKVPFTFIVGNERLPAGDYEVKEMTDGGGILAVQSADGRHHPVGMKPKALGGWEIGRSGAGHPER